MEGGRLLDPGEVAGVGQHDPAGRREGPFQGVDSPAGADVVGAVDQQDGGPEVAAGAEQAAQGPTAVGVQGAGARPVRPQVRGELALGALQGPGAID